MTGRSPDFRLMVGPEPFDPVELVQESAAAGARATVVQFAASLSGPDIARLQAAYGLRLDRFVPNLAYLERLDAATADRVRADFLVRAVTPFPQASKLSPDIPATGPLNLTAVLFDDSDATAVTAALTALGARDVATSDAREFGGRLRLVFGLDDATRLAQVAALDDVTWLEPAPAVENQDVPSAQTLQSGDPARGTVWDRHLHGEDQVIQIIEEGTLDLNHCFFADAAPNRPGPGHRKVRALFKRANTALDSHFMKVAGIAAGDEIGNSGQHQDRGGAWAAKIVGNDSAALRDLGPNHRSVHQFLEDGRGVGATVHNFSWVNAITVRYESTARDVDAFCFAREEQVVVAGGPNTRPNAKNLPPGIALNAICVAAARAHPGHMSRGSGVDGPSFDSRRKPDLMAVGCGIRTSVLPPAPSQGLYCDTALQACGTSFATPNASAAAALVRQYFTQGFYPNGKPEQDKVVKQPSGALIKAVLLNATVDMTGHPGYPSDIEGWGLIQLDRALFFENGTRKLIVHDVRRAAALGTSTTRSYGFTVDNAGEQLKITFVWTSQAMTEVAPFTPDPIRFEVEDPAGGFYMGNDFDVPNGVSRKLAAPPKAPPDIANNVQMVVVNNPAPGAWTIRLRPVLTRAPQGFALVITGGVR
ncbi:S8 family serine peptidase [Nonomuraea sp. NEAU-A123]|uniref:S8 family serine peptidase n=1 Tax=Nonomuraea sp. NEAU-A123 TaxID=2839649 RepID=UPI001BE41FDB|nr:S8 family serine peptidase [Nonomuraea sp. NEAU-A123]MBT2226080.1 S8 family serine peptidase [Nonomuraea sp. NEAU-A123]